MLLRTWISDQLHAVVGFTTPAVVDYLIAQAAAPTATAAQLEAFLQQSTQDGTHTDRAAQVQTFARELIDRVPKKSNPAARGTAAAEEERRKREAVRRNEQYALLAADSAMDEEDEHRRKMKEAKQRGKDARLAEKVKRRERRSHSSDDDDEDERPSKRQDRDREKERKDERSERDEEKEEKKDDSDSGADPIASMSPAELAEYRKQQDRQARDAFIARLSERDKGKTKNVADKAANKREREDKELNEMTQEEMRALLPQLRRKAREQYLTRREQQQLQLLQLTLEDEQGRWKEEELTEKERRELTRRRKLLELAQQRKGLTDEVAVYRMPEAYTREDGSEDVKKRQAVLERRYVEEKKVESEYEGWEREQSKKSQLSVGSRKAEQGAEYEFVFDEAQIEFVQADRMAGTDSKDGQPSVKQEAESKAHSEFERIQESRRKLPIYPYREELLAAVRQYQVLIIVGETGSGQWTHTIQPHATQLHFADDKYSPTAPSCCVPFC